jgi:hypothetical protein
VIKNSQAVSKKMPDENTSPSGKQAIIDPVPEATESANSNHNHETSPANGVASTDLPEATGSQEVIGSIVEETPADTAQDKKTSSSGTGVIAQFVVFPLAIVLGIVGIFAFFNWATKSNRTYAEYLRAIDSGWESDRWQAAYELQFRITDKRDGLLQTADIPATLKVFDNSKTFRDQRVRPVLAVLLGFLGDAKAIPALTEALNDKNDETRMNAIYALGRLKASAAVPALLALLDRNTKLDQSKKGAFYKVIAFTLGEIGQQEAIPALLKLLKNGKDDVRWNAALALARFGDVRAVPTIKAMLDRRYLESIQSMRPKGRDKTIINALRGVRMLNAQTLKDEVSFLAGSDPSYRVRQAALEVLASFKKISVKQKSN